MTDMSAVADDVVDALAAVVAAAIPVLKSRIPPVPAAELGRTAAPSSAALPPASPVRRSSSSASLLAERLLGALELTLPGLDMTGAPDLSPYLPAPGQVRRNSPSATTVSSGHSQPARAGRTASPRRPAQPAQPARAGMAVSRGLKARSAAAGPPPVAGRVPGPGQASGQAMTAATLLDQFRPGTSELVTALSRRLSAHLAVAPLLAVVPEAAVPPEEMTEETIAAAHGGAYLALAVAVALIAAGDDSAIRGPGFSREAAAVGLGVGAARVLLSEIPMPESYTALVLAQERAKFQLPRGATGRVAVAGHRFALAEGPFPAGTDPDAEPGNGLVTVVPGGVVIRTGLASGVVHVNVRVGVREPALNTDMWDEVVDVSWHAEQGRASVIAPENPENRGDADDRGLSRRLREMTPPGPGDYRLRVHARGRDGDLGNESYQLDVWQAPPAPEIAHKHTDSLGYRLRGEPEPERPVAPEHAYRWISRSELSMAAAITVVTGSAVAEVLRAFGADPDDPESLRELRTEALEDVSPGISVAVDADSDTGAVVVVEDNGYQGTIREVLARASAGGRAASMYWNVNGVTRLSFAEHGEVLLSYEPFGPPYGMESVGVPPEVLETLDGLIFADVRDKHEKGLVAVERFTGRGITQEDLERILAADVGYRIEP